MKEILRRLICGCTALAAFILCLITHISEDSMIISFGVKTVRTLRSISLIVMIPMLAILATDITLSLIKNKKEQQNKLKTMAEQEDVLRELNKAKEQENAILNSNRMNPEKVRTILMRKVPSVGASLQKILGGICEQMSSMDSCQARLHSLLEMNGASKLKDSENALDDAEQMLCQNVRKVLNIMEAGASEEECKELASCIFNANEAILDKSGSFVLQLAKYLNSQDNSSMDVLDSYRDAISEVLKTTNM